MNTHNGQGDPLNELRALIEQFKKNFKVTGPLIGLVILGAFLMSSFYTVEADEQAVVTRLGRYSETTNPGLHFKMPLGVDKVIKVKTTILHQEEFGFRTRGYSQNGRTSYSSRGYDDESLMLTGDLNVADVEWVVQYMISDPYKYLFQTSSPLQNIRDISESIMRRVVGDRLVSDVLTTGRVEISSKAKELMQKVLNRYDLGITVRTVQLQDVNPPESVKPSFNEVNEAKQEQEKVINQAERFYNRVIPEAKGKAEKLVSEAEGEGAAMVAKSEGDASKFLSLYREYKRAPSIMRKRLYLETMGNLLSNMKDLTIIDPKVKGLLPVFTQKSTVGEK